MADSERQTGLDDLAQESEAHLVLARPSVDGADAYCRDQLAPAGHPESAPIVVLTEGDPGDPLLGSDVRGRRGVVVAVGDELRSGAVGAEDSGGTEAWPATVFVSDDLGEVGRTVDGYLTAWASSGYRPTVCVDSLSGLVGRSSIHGAYRFLYVLRRRIDDVGGDLHVHGDPSDHEEEILRTFFSVFDRVVSFDDGGSPLP